MGKYVGRTLFGVLFWVPTLLKQYPNMLGCDSDSKSIMANCAVVECIRSVVVLEVN